MKCFLLVTIETLAVTVERAGTLTGAVGSSSRSRSHPVDGRAQRLLGRLPQALGALELPECDRRARARCRLVRHPALGRPGSSCVAKPAGLHEAALWSPRRLSQPVGAGGRHGSWMSVARDRWASPPARGPGLFGEQSVAVDDSGGEVDQLAVVGARALAQHLKRCGLVD